MLLCAELRWAELSRAERTASRRASRRTGGVGLLAARSSPGERSLVAKSTHTLHFLGEIQASFDLLNYINNRKSFLLLSLNYYLTEGLLSLFKYPWIQVIICFDISYLQALLFLDTFSLVTFFLYFCFYLQESKGGRVSTVPFLVRNSRIPVVFKIKALSSNNLQFEWKCTNLWIVQI